MTVAVSAMLLALLWFAMLTLGAGPLDDAVLIGLYQGDRPAIAAVARFFTFFGDWWVVLAISVAAALWLFYRHSWRRGVAVFAVTLVGRLLVTGQKYGIERLRPDQQAHLVQVSTPSFPSGHAAGSVILYLTLALVLTSGTRWKWPAVAAAAALAFVIGLSRIMLGVHWPTDVIGGWAFGLLWVMLALPWAERLAAPRR